MLKLHRHRFTSHRATSKGFRARNDCAEVSTTSHWLSGINSNKARSLKPAINNPLVSQRCHLSWQEHKQRLQRRPKLKLKLKLKLKRKCNHRLLPFRAVDFQQHVRRQYLRLNDLQPK